MQDFTMEEIDNFKARFLAFLQHRKKMMALENYMVEESPQLNLLKALKAFMHFRFLDSKEQDFIDHMLDKCGNLDYLRWCYKTKKLKAKIESRKRKVDEKPKINQLILDFDKAISRQSYSVPIEIINQNPSSGFRIGT